MSKDPLELVVCLGSACFSRGNARAVREVQAYIASRHLADEVQLTGTLCPNRCRQGPNATLSGECLCGVDPVALRELLEDRLARAREQGS